MGRPSRSWVRKTYTVSPEVERAIAMKAAEQDIDPGTLIDILVWNALVKPDEEQLKKSEFSHDALERIFAEEVLALLDGKGAVEELAESLLMGGDEKTSLQQVRSRVRRWRRTRIIEKEHQGELLSAIGGGAWIPLILKKNLVDLDWFEPEE